MNNVFHYKFTFYALKHKFFAALIIHELYMKEDLTLQYEKSIRAYVNVFCPGWQMDFVNIFWPNKTSDEKERIRYCLQRCLAGKSRKNYYCPPYEFQYKLLTYKNDYYNEARIRNQGSGNVLSHSKCA